MTSSKNSKIIQIRRADFATVYQSHFDSLYQYALVILRSPEAAKDVVSDVFLSLWNANKPFSEINDMSNYLFRAVKNAAIHYQVKDQRMYDRQIKPEFLQVIDSIDPESLLIGSELQNIVDAVIDSLPAQSAIIYRMIKVERKKAAEVGMEMNMTEGAVRNHISNILKKVKQEIIHRNRKNDTGLEELMVLFVLFSNIVTNN